MQILPPRNFLSSWGHGTHNLNLMMGHSEPKESIRLKKFPSRMSLERLPGGGET